MRPDPQEPLMGTTVERCQETSKETRRDCPPQDSFNLSFLVSSHVSLSEAQARSVPSGPSKSTTTFFGMIPASAARSSTSCTACRPRAPYSTVH